MGKKVKKEPESFPKDVFDPLSIESKNAATAVLMLSSPEEDVLAKACEAIHKFAEKGDENKSSLMGLGAVEPLSRLISHEDKIVQKKAVMALGVMASNCEVKKGLKSMDVMPAIISKLSPQEDLVVLEFATLCLAFLSVDCTFKVQIFEHKGLEPLIRLLCNPDADVKKNSAECIFNLVQDFQNRAAVPGLNGFPPLLDLLCSEFPVIQQLAMRTIETITSDRESLVAFRNAQGLNKILEVLANKEFHDLHGVALKVISNCLEDSESVWLIQGVGGLEHLLQFVITPTLPEVQANAVKAIARVAQNGEIRKILHGQNVEKALTDLLTQENDNIRIATCQAVATVSKNLSSRDIFRSLDAIKLIVRLLNSEGSELRTAAAEALSGLTDNNKLNAYAVYDAGGDKLLVRQLRDSCAWAAVHAAVVCTNMAKQEELRSCILAHGAMPALVELLHSSDNHTLISATQAVASLACDAEARQELRNVGGLTHLIKLLRSINADVRRNACWAVSVCANDEITAIEMCNAGALEILQEINLSVHRKSKLSEVALQKLQDNSLSLKYSLTGHLPPTDITTDGFYDPGQIRMGQQVPTLEDLSKQSVNQHRAIIAVNGKQPDQLIPKGPDERKQDSPTETGTSSVMSSKRSSKTPIKMKGKGQKEEKKDEEEIKPQQEVVLEEGWKLPYDAEFHNLVKQAVKSVLPLDDAKMYTALAVLVCDAMGGQVEPEKLHDFLWELHISKLKLEINSNIIPIGKIKKGIYFHRALLFKVLADRIGLRCSLVRGQYNRAWNEILLINGPKKPYGYTRPENYIIDLIHQPGNLMKSNSAAALAYQSI
ncbi:armadillo repeat-containing protein 3 [Triplophysa dalaica]|uniref:armadillo repeat-containing protein 3 n=1 Tax=Triplophysa dalaica TaxID=1582913 RepID=UPI0024DF66FF|nr:armadillo repeat-containing protein 3 [Triplophysa dalaica]XP_056593980.1 armadillo repeat-containing protein 3 [Triplophysa dalaica]